MTNNSHDASVPSESLDGCSGGEVQFDWLWPWLKPLVDQNTNLARHLLLKPMSYRHHLALLSVVSPSAGEIPGFSSDLIELSDEEIFGRYPGMLNVIPLLEYIPDNLQSFSYYEILVDSLMNGNLQILRNVGELLFERLLAIKTLPSELCCSETIRCINTYEELHTIETFWAQCLAGRKDLSKEEVFTAIRRALEENLGYIHRGIEPPESGKLYPHPWQGDDQINPIRTVKSLEEILSSSGLEFLAWGRSFAVGDCHFYLYDGKQKAIVTVEPKNGCYLVDLVRPIDGAVMSIEALVDIKIRFGLNGIYGFNFLGGANGEMIDWERQPSFS